MVICTRNPPSNQIIGSSGEHAHTFMSKHNCIKATGPLYWFYSENISKLGEGQMITPVFSVGG